MGMFDKYLDKASPEAVTGAAVDAEAAPAGKGADSAIFETVKGIIEEVRPFIQADGGDCELVKVEDGVVWVRLVGSCVGCPSSLATLKGGLQLRIKEAVPEVSSVEMI